MCFCIKAINKVLGSWKLNRKLTKVQNNHVYQKAKAMWTMNVMKRERLAIKMKQNMLSECVCVWVYEKWFHSSDVKVSQLAKIIWLYLYIKSLFLSLFSNIIWFSYIFFSHCALMSYTNILKYEKWKLWRFPFEKWLKWNQVFRSQNHTHRKCEILLTN